MIGVVVPLYLAECLGASNRGKGTGIFQWLLTLGIVAAAVIGLYFSIRVDEVAKLGDAAKLFAFKDTAWRSIFWVSLPPGILFVIGSFMVAESPRWLFRRGKKDAARAALLRSRTEEQAEIELKEMEETAAAEKAKSPAGARIKESLLRRKYVIPFVLACIILACNQATGVNSIIGYNATILIQAGLGDKQAHLGYRPFHHRQFSDDHRRRRAGGPQRPEISALARHRRRHRFAGLRRLAVSQNGKTARGLQRRRAGDGRDRIKRSRWPSIEATATNLARRQPAIAQPADDRWSSFIPTAISARPPRRCVPTTRRPNRLKLHATDCVPANKVVAFFKNPFANLDAARSRAVEN